MPIEKDFEQTLENQMINWLEATWMAQMPVFDKGFIQMNRRVPSNSFEYTRIFYIIIKIDSLFNQYTLCIWKFNSNEIQSNFSNKWVFSTCHFTHFSLNNCDSPNDCDKWGRKIGKIFYNNRQMIEISGRYTVYTISSLISNEKSKLWWLLLTENIFLKIIDVVLRASKPQNQQFFNWNHTQKN